MDEQINTGVDKVQPQQATQTPSKEPSKLYPTVEEMTFRGIIKSEEEGYALLRAIQILVNELGATAIIQVVKAIEQNPKILQQVKTYLPYIKI